MDRVWGQAKTELERLVGANNYANWIQPLRLASLRDGTADLVGPTKFLSDWVARHYAEPILSVLVRHGCEVERLTFRVDPTIGARAATFAGLAGLGDLAATCTSPLSRNRTFGERLGRGESLEEAQRHTRQVTEGVKSCRSIRDLARKHGVEMPITDAIVAICHEGRSAVDVVPELMGRAPKKEGL